MDIEAGKLDQRSIVEVIRDVHRHGRTGVLEIEEAIEDGSRRRRFYFVEGDLHLHGSHSLAERLKEFLASRKRLAAGAEGEKGKRDAGARAEVVKQLDDLVRRVADVLVAAKVGSFSFESGGALPEDLVGPFPTEYLIMEAAVRDQDSEALLRGLGGAEALVVARADPEALTEMYGIDPGEMFLLSRAEAPIQVTELLRQVSSDRDTALRMLGRLQAIDLLEILDRSRSRVAGSSGMVESVVARFLDRVAARLKSQPVSLDPAQHRKRLAELLSQFGSQSHYELLAVGFHDGPEEIHAAYDDLARLVHPNHATRLGLGGKQAALRLLFERATMAYLTLTDPERRAEYNLQAGIEARRSQTADERSAEQAAVARANYERAQELVEHQDYHFALELVRQAVRADPAAPYFALLGRVQSQNPHWVHQAAESYRQAIKLEPDQSSYRVELAKLMETTGDLNRARVHYRAALQKDPGCSEAAEALERLGASGSLTLPSDRPTFLDRLRRLWE